MGWLHRPPAEFHDAGPAVVVEGRYTGTYKETGRKFDAQVCHVWKIRDGKITSFQQYVDTAQMQDGAGADTRYRHIREAVTCRVKRGAASSRTPR